MNPRMIPVLSSNIDGYQHISKTQQMLITFKGGSTYAYENVPLSLADQFLHTSSKGKFFGEHIRDQYTTSKLSPEEVIKILENVDRSFTPQPKPTPRKATVSLQKLVQAYPFLRAVF